MGLLDNFAAMPADDQQAWNSALMQMAGALLTPRSQGGGMGAAFTAFPAAMERAKAQSQKNEMFGLQKQQIESDIADRTARRAEEDRRRTELARFIAGLPPEQQSFAALAPQEFIKSLMKGPQVVSAGGALVGQDGKPIYQAPFKPEAPTELARLIRERDQLPQGDPRRANYDAAINRTTTHPSAMTVNYGSPVIGIGPDGKPAFYQPSNKGGLVPTGISPGVASKPMPASVVKEQSDLVENIGIAENIKADMGGILKQIESGKLNLGMASNFWNKARNVAGSSTEESRNFSSFMATLEKLRNDSLRLNKGVQTEGDAIRAWNELFANINDSNVVKQRIEEIQRINERAANLHQSKLDMMREEYGRGSLDTSAVRNPQPAVGQSQGGNSRPPLSSFGQGQSAARPPLSSFGGM